MAQSIVRPQSRSTGLLRSVSRMAFVLPLMAFPAHAHAQTVPAGEQDTTTAPTSPSTPSTPSPPTSTPAPEPGSTPAPGPSAAAADEAIITVTGSRLGAGFTAPTPVMTVGAEQIQDRAITSVAELNYEIPQLRINQNIGRSSEPVGQNQIDLRGLGQARTLVLLDGRRVGATSPFGGVDSNIFPTALLSSVDVVTGGASAAYGSDAVAGVINFQLQKNFTGLKVDASYGISEYNDFKRPVISAAAGTSLLDDRLHLVAAGEFYRNTGQTEQASRPWGRGRPVLFADPNGTGTNGTTTRYIAYDARLFGTFGGLIVGNNADTSAANGVDVLRGIQFGTNGAPLPFAYGSPSNSTFMIGGDGDSVEDEGNIMPFITRYSGYGRAGFDISSDVSVWTDVLWSRVVVDSDLTPNFDLGSTALTIQSTNAFLPESIRQVMVDNDISSFRLGRINIEDGFSENNGKSRALRYAAGVEGRFGTGWAWDAFVQRSDNRFSQESVNNRIQANWFAGVDSIISPVTGQPVCRINADASSTNDNPACVPINVFGQGSISQAALDWYRGTSYYNAKMTQNAAGANLRGAPFATWAGDVAVALGAEYRHETIDSVSDPLSVARAWRSINQQPFTGDLTVKEVYFETAIPLASEMAFADDLEINGAVRYADYSSSGGVTTWKVGLNYSPIPDIRFRGTISRDIRAANINELYAGQNQVITNLIDPRPDRPSPQYSIIQLAGGNPDLQPENADTKALGVVLQPSFINGLNLSIDYFNIKIDGAITAIASQDIIDNCFTRNLAEFCDFLVVDPASNLITQVAATLQNAQQVKTSGVDFELSYRRPSDFIRAGSSLSARLLVNYVHDLALTLSGVTTDYVGDYSVDYSGQPRWKANFDLTYQGGPLRLGAYVRYIGNGKYRSFYIDDVDIPADQNNVKGRAYLDVSAAYKITDFLEFYGKVDNVLDIDPPIIPNSITQPTVANSQMFDKIGRYYVAGVRLRF